MDKTSIINELNDRKAAAVEFLSSIGKGKPKDGLRFFAPDCKTHNPYTSGGMNALTDAMIDVQNDPNWDEKEAELKIRHVLADGDMVAVYTQLSGSNPKDGGLRQVHLFRFDGDKIVEYWDVTQVIEPGMPNAAGAF